MWFGTMSPRAGCPAPRPGAQVLERRLAAEVVGDPVVVDRVGRRDRVVVAAPALDPREAGCAATARSATAR